MIIIECAGSKEMLDAEERRLRDEGFTVERLSEDQKADAEYYTDLSKNAPEDFVVLGGFVTELVKSVINKEKPAVSFAEARDLIKALQAEDVKMICLTDSLGALTSGLDERGASQTITANMMLKGHAEEFGIPVVDGGTEYIEELKSELDHSER